MIETVLHLWLATGRIVSGPIPIEDCTRHIEIATAAVASGGYAEMTEGGRPTGIIVRMQCDGHDVVLALPPSSVNCEEPTS